MTIRRARETAQILCDRLRSQQAVVIDANLRERGFGRLEGHSNQRYDEVWAFDQTLGPDHTQLAVER